MPTKISLDSSILVGIEGRPVRITARFSPGRDTIRSSPHCEGLRESLARIREAFRAIGSPLPPGRYFVEISEEHPLGRHRHLDLPIAVALAVASGLLEPNFPGAAYAGEIASDGSLLPIRGAFIVAEAARLALFIGIIVPTANMHEAAGAAPLDVRGAGSLSDVLAFIRRERDLPRASTEPAMSTSFAAPDLADVPGQHHAKRALELCAAGGHHILLIGLSRGDRTTLAQCAPGLFPPLSRADSLQVTRIHSAAGTHSAAGLIRSCPFRNPHPAISTAGLLGGGTALLPGEVSLAHAGVLWMDDLPVFRRPILEGLQAALADRRVSLLSAGAEVRFPADFTLIATMATCPCGRGQPAEGCTCTPAQVGKHLDRLRRALLEQIDLHVPVHDGRRGGGGTSERRDEPSEAVRERVTRARERQIARYGSSPARLNARMTYRDIQEHCVIGEGSMGLIRTAIARLQVSARGYHEVLKLARTIADLHGVDDLTTDHVREAIQHRARGRSSAG
jgi:magnesium chelatase family protein